MAEQRITGPVNDPGRRDLTIVRKTAETQVVSNSTTLVNDDALLVGVAANEIVYFLCLTHQLGNSTADFKLTFTVPSGATISWSLPNAHITVADAIQPPNFVNASGTTISVGSTTTGRGQLAVGMVHNGATLGNLQLQWAQVTATVVDTKVLTDSFLLVWRV